MTPIQETQPLTRQRSYADLREFFDFNEETRVKTARVATETLQVPEKRQKIAKDIFKEKMI